MPSKITIRGRNYYSRGYDSRHTNQAVRPTQRGGEPLNVTTPIAPQEVDKTLRAGIPYTCPTEKVTYRVIKNCDPRERWASSEFWQNHLKVGHRGLLRLLKLGWFDAAIEEGSQARRYRCRDERKMKESWDWRKLRDDQRKAAARKMKAERLKKRVGYRGFSMSPATPQS
jgi:hypothetical protein